MPIREQREEKTVYRTVSYGSLADLIMLDTRIIGRDEQAPLTSDPSLLSADRTMLGTEQKAWFLDQLEQSTAKWKLIGNQVIFSEFNIGWSGGLVGQSFERAESTFLDIWDGYPYERSQLVNFIRDEEIDNVVILTGDFHTSMAYEVVDPPVQVAFVDGKPAYTLANYDPETGAGAVAVEFASPSVASANFDETASPFIALALQNQLNQPLAASLDLGTGNPNPHMKYVDLIKHGYFVLDVLEDRVQADYFYTPVLERTPEETFDRGLSTPSGEHHLTVANGAAPGKATQDAPAPANPPGLIDGVRRVPTDVTVLAVAPNPAGDWVNLQYAVRRRGAVTVDLLDAGGRRLRGLQEREQVPGLYTLRASLEGLAAGSYLLRITSGEGSSHQRLIKR